MTSAYGVRRADWDRDLKEIRQIRELVFVCEQNVPLELEWDGLDESCVHLLAEDSTSAPIGTGRLLPDGHIGRMAVLMAWRRCGVGTALLHELISIARERGFGDVVVNAQTYAIRFYQRHGFVAEGPEFLDAGIWHRKMRLGLR